MHVLDLHPKIDSLWTSRAAATAWESTIVTALRALSALHEHVSCLACWLPYMLTAYAQCDPCQDPSASSHRKECCFTFVSQTSQCWRNYIDIEPHSHSLMLFSFQFQD